MDGANGQTGGKNRSSTFVLTAFISFGPFKYFPSVVADLIRDEKLKAGYYLPGWLNWPPNRLNQLPRRQSG
jgi:hypothetical protein